MVKLLGVWSSVLRYLVYLPSLPSWKAASESAKNGDQILGGDFVELGTPKNTQQQNLERKPLSFCQAYLLNKRPKPVIYSSNYFHHRSFGVQYHAGSWDIGITLIRANLGAKYSKTYIISCI